MNMNPLLYKAHPLLRLTVELLVDPAAHSLREVALLALVYLAVCFVLALVLWRASNAVVGITPSLLLAYVLALPAALAYFAPMLTLLADVVAHEFHFADRFILVFCVFVAAQMLGGLYAVAIRHPGSGAPIGLGDGLAISLLLWLASLPLGLAGLWLNAEFKII
jgi:hypothetical protein